MTIKNLDNFYPIKSIVFTTSSDIVLTTSFNDQTISNRIEKRETLGVAFHRSPNCFLIRGRNDD